MDHPRPGLRYVDASNLDDNAWRLNGRPVNGTDGERLGSVEGFILDRRDGRPFYIVVGAGSWFTHKHFLLPVGHTAVAGDSFVADLTKERVKRFPGFDRDKFKELSGDELKQMEQQLTSACCPEEVVVVDMWEARDHFRYPTWWEAGFYPPERLESGDDAGVTTPRARSTAADRKG
jgi:hypothetical protein